MYRMRMDKDLTELSFCLSDVTTVNWRQEEKVTAVRQLSSY